MDSFIVNGRAKWAIMEEIVEGKKNILFDFMSLMMTLYFGGWVGS